MRILFFALLCSTEVIFAQETNLNVLAYYSGGPEYVERIAAEKLTHIIFSFGHLKGNQFNIGSKRDSTTVYNLVQLKTKNPALKIILSLGGWGGCATCSDVFSSAEARKEFANSVLKACTYFKTDGIDLDWEYPSIQGYPGHAFNAADKNNFTELIKELRKTLGAVYQISFAAGGFQKFIDESVDWRAIMPLLDRVNLMTYDLVHGYSTETGHHTALYSTPQQHESTDNAVQSLIKLGVPANKLVIGAAFYGRMWEDVPAINNGLYQPGKFKRGVDYKDLNNVVGPGKGFVYYWDDVAKAPYQYNAGQKLYFTYDDKKSIALKTKYAIDQKLDGIMFWELACDQEADGLLDEIVAAKRSSKK
ncbi:MAG TPA: glycoside hydrolase family 18 protein [Cyclobacteriaceae bacterium]|nr:glycoside hydrolase family 18 protein [Cyclobacteriaceae bacterium]HMV08325.1 glycoside hydrolase family 18 protein [Cyclobacteriaceae bacterium]HMV88398.1 glycoside hydrolase family 18 protein [Cyclobacteriaceae bacterium]HMX02168.1 glycoside hydrolase family 18 protein [Cyclobacteriaceae bacterium]HMX49856.1 glycoside hydrolase family 18 protein [Cyclobacteriaceae bacterium]